MKALTLTVAEGPDSAELKDHDLPQPKAGEVRVRLKAASLNHREIWITKGLYWGVTLPCTMGCDGAGVVEALGEGVDRGLIGRDVMLYPGLDWGANPDFPRPGYGLLGMPGPGTLAEAVCVSAQRLVEKPAYLTFEEAAAVPLGALTAWRGLTTKGRLKAGETVLITGVGGGVATFALTLALSMGARAFVTSGSDETLAKAMALGAAGGVNYRTPDWGKALTVKAGGIDVVFDGAPAAGYGEYGRGLNVGARVVVYGATGGAEFPVHAPNLFHRNVTVTGTNVGNPDEFRAVVAFMARHEIKPVIEAAYPLSQAKAALAHLAGSHQFGKVVIVNDIRGDAA